MTLRSDDIALSRLRGPDWGKAELSSKPGFGYPLVRRHSAVGVIPPDIIMESLFLAA